MRSCSEIILVYYCIRVHLCQLFSSLLMGLKVHTWYLVSVLNRHNLKILFCCLSWIFLFSLSLLWDSYKLSHFYWSYYLDIWIDILYICMCPLLRFQMLIKRLYHHSMRRQHHLLGFKYCNHVSRLPWINSLKWDHELWTEDNSGKTVYRI